MRRDVDIMSTQNVSYSMASFNSQIAEQSIENKYVQVNVPIYVAQTPGTAKGFSIQGSFQVFSNVELIKTVGAQVGIFVQYTASGRQPMLQQRETVVEQGPLQSTIRREKDLLLTASGYVSRGPQIAEAFTFQEETNTKRRMDEGDAIVVSLWCIVPNEAVFNSTNRAFALDEFITCNLNVRTFIKKN